MKNLHNKKGFTLLELMFVISIILIFVGGMLASYERGHRRHRTPYSCMSNQRQLALAWYMYAQDHDDRIMPNYQDGGTNHAIPGWVSGNMNWDNNNRDNTNTLLLTDRNYAGIGVYLGKASRVFKCPKDNYAVPGESITGGKQRVRSYSMNAFFNMDNTTNSDYAGLKIFKKNTDFRNPTRLWILTDEHPDSIGDPCFFPNAVKIREKGTNVVRGDPNRTAWGDTPSALHDGGSSFAFADGHSEIHKWRTSSMRKQGGKVRFQNFDDKYNIEIGNNRQDWDWLAERSTQIY